MNKKILLLLTSITTLFIIIISIVIVISDNQNTKHVSISILSDKSDYRVNENITFYVDDIPDNANITWYIDGNFSSFSKDYQVIFNVSKIYYVRALCKWKDNIGDQEISVGVKNQNNIEYTRRSNIVIIRPTQSSLTYSQYIVERGISDPEVDISISLTNVIGRFSITILCFYSDMAPADHLFEDEFRYYSPRDYSEDFTYDISSFDYPKNPLRFQVELELFEGSIDYCEIISVITY